MLKAHNFRQTKPCQDCPFLKVGGVRHGAAVLDYASYFTKSPAQTFPCHKTRPKTDDNSHWNQWQDDQTMCAGGLIFAQKVGQPNELWFLAKLFDWSTDQQSVDAVVDSFAQLVDLQK